MITPASPQPGNQNERKACGCDGPTHEHHHGCTKFAAAAADQPTWAGTTLESCIRDVALGRIASHSAVTPELVAEWRRHNPERAGVAPAQSGDVLDDLWWKPTGGEADEVRCWDDEPGCDCARRSPTPNVGRCTSCGRSASGDEFRISRLCQVCLNGPLPAPSAGQGCGGEADGPTEDDVVGTCDWGGCNGDTVALRRDSRDGRWLSVCVRHRTKASVAVELVMDGEPWPYSAEAADELVKDLAHDLGISPAPSAGQDTERLRDEVLRTLLDAAPQWPWDRVRTTADALLDGPLRQLIAERDEARAQVQRVRELHAPLDRGTGPHCQGCATHITFTPWPCATIRVLGDG